MKLQRYILLMVLVFTLGGCASQGRVPGNKITGQDFVEISDFFHAYMEAFNSRDMYKLIGFYAPHSLTYVLNEDEGYYLTKDALLKAFELKKEGWAQKNMHLEEVKISNSSATGSTVTVNVEFSVNSNTWLGEYNIRYAVDKVNGQYQIVRENM